MEDKSGAAPAPCASNSSPQTTSVHKFSSAFTSSLTNTNANPAPSTPPPAAAIPSRSSSPSTISLTSSFDSTTGSLLTLSPTQTITTTVNTASEQQIPMSATLAAARAVNANHNIWDPDDSEWADAEKVVDTFRSSYRLPSDPTALSALPGPPYHATSDEEKIAKKVEELGNTYFYDPDGDANDEVMKSVFARPTGYFSGGEVRKMHVIDMNAYFQSKDALVKNARPRLADVVATVLAHTSKGCLGAFLDPRIGEFVFRRKVEGNEGGLILVIRRAGNEVICGAYRNLGFKMLWKVYVKSVVGVTGEWYETFAAMGAGEMVVGEGGPEWNHLQTGGENEGEAVIEEKKGERKLELGSSPKKKDGKKKADDGGETDPKLMLFQSRVLATHLLWDVWVRLDGKYECRATWSADGEEEIVRLGREVVGAGEYDG